MSNQVKKFAGSLLLAFAAAAQADAAIVTFSAVGKITSGYDYADTFGGGLHMKGMAYSQSITIDTAALDRNNYGVGINHVGGLNQKAVVLGTTTVNNRSYHWRIEGQEAYVYLWDLHAIGDTLNSAGVGGQGHNALDGQFSAGFNTLFSRTATFLTSIDFAQTRRFNDLTGTEAYSLFQTNKADRMQTFFGGRPDAMVWEVQSIPEPASLGMVMLGLGLALSNFRRRRSV